MPVAPTYPGVYVQEISSGVRTITSASTSTAAFVGWTRSGPVNRPIRTLSWADFERRFGGFANDSDLSYAVHQFYANGGTEAWIVRVAKDAAAATLQLQGDSSLGAVLQIDALDEGSAGNEIAIEIEYAKPDVEPTFSLLVEYRPTGDPSLGKTERYDGISMHSAHPRYIERIVGQGSQLVSASRLVTGTEGGTYGGPIVVATVDTDLSNSGYNALRIQVDGGTPIDIGWDASTDLPGPNRLDQLLALVVSQAATAGATITAVVDVDHVVLESSASEDSSVSVLDPGAGDAAALLGLTAATGAQEVSALDKMRPLEIPDQGTLVGATISGDPPLGSMFGLGIEVDGSTPIYVGVGGYDTGAWSEARLQSIAAAIQSTMRMARPGLPGCAAFEATGIWTDDGPPGEGHLMLTSGTKGEGSSVRILPLENTGDNDKVVALGLQTGATATDGQDVYLAGGSESPFSTAEQLSIFDGSQLDREGIYALESVESFNLLCLPGITDSNVLSAAATYCQQRRAFLIVDSPVTGGANAVLSMEATVTTGSLPASDHAAVYFPWVYVADREKPGLSRLCPPCGVMAGIYARTDAQRGVWKTPAGIDAPIVGIEKLAYELIDLENGVLNKQGINCLRRFPAIGPVPWGGRTLRGADAIGSEYKYAAIRRLALTIESSIVTGTQWVVFEPNDEPLWAQIRLNVGAYMDSLFRQGAFQGASPNEAYFVHCDAKTNPQYDIDRGIVNIVVGFAPLKPVEFVVITIQQMAGQAAND